MSKREIYRILDAAANRGREALRVVEDAARFLGDSERLSALLKELRHRFAAAADKLDRRERMLARDTTGDVGVEIEADDEYERTTLMDVLVANFARLQESARSLEEYSKLVEPELSREWEQIRYAAYSLEKLAYEVAEQSDGAKRPSDPDDLAQAAPGADAPSEIPTATPEAPRDERPTESPEPAASQAAPTPEEEAPREAPQENAPPRYEFVAPEAPRSPEPPRDGASPRGARRAKLYDSRLCVYVDRETSTSELKDLLDSSADVFELSFDASGDDARVEQTEAFLRQWFNKYPDAVRSLDGRPLLLSRDTRLWGEALDGWVVPIQSAVNAREVIGDGALLGVIVSTRDEALAALQAWSAGYADFIEVGPVFSDQGSIRRIGVDFLREFAEICQGPAPLPIFAFGGIDERNCGAVFDSGIERLGVGAAILGAPNKSAAVARLKSLF